MPFLSRRGRLWKGVKVWVPLVIFLYITARLLSHSKLSAFNQDAAGPEKQAYAPNKQFLQGNAGKEMEDDSLNL